MSADSSIRFNAFQSRVGRELPLKRPRRIGGSVFNTPRSRQASLSSFLTSAIPVSREVRGLAHKTPSFHSDGARQHGCHRSEISHGFGRRTMDFGRGRDPAAKTSWAGANYVDASGGQRDSLSSPYALLVAHVAARLPALAHGLRLPSAMAVRRHVAADLPGVDPKRPRPASTGGEPLRKVFLFTCAGA